MSGQYQQLGGLDDSAIHIPIPQEKSQELSTQVNDESHRDSHDHSNCKHSSSETQSSNHSTHNHSHGDKCGHSHESGQECKSKKSKRNSDWGIRFFTMFMPINCYILAYFWLNEVLIGNYFEYYGSIMLMTFVIIMCSVSYYQAVTIKNRPVSRAPPPCDPSIFDPIQRNDAVCKDCNLWKPMRTKHCRTCEFCQLKMDHHCPWITNCVGLRNNRAFFLFVVYMAVTYVLINSPNQTNVCLCKYPNRSVEYCYRSLIYFQYLSVIDDFWQNSTFFYFYWFITTLILVPICVMLCGLSVFHFLLLVNNATTLDMMGGLSLGMPFTPPQGVNPSKRTVNIFNRGLISNIRDFFSGDLFLFWWPFETITPNDGTYYEMAPPCTFNDIQNIVRNQIVNEDGINLNSLVTDFDRRIDEEKERLKECNLQVGGQIFELWRDVLRQKNEEARIEAEKQIGHSSQKEQLVSADPSHHTEEISLL